MAVASITKICLSAQYNKVRTTHSITTKHGSFINPRPLRPKGYCRHQHLSVCSLNDSITLDMLHTCAGDLSGWVLYRQLELTKLTHPDLHHVVGLSEL